MRKNFVKRTSALALAAFMAASAAGCSSGGGSRTAAAPDTTAQAAASGEEAKADGDKGETESSGEPVTIRLVHYMGEQAKRDALDAMLAAFNEAHPEIHVDVEVVASSSYIATLKTILARRTVVFIGFSFGDEDFSQIMAYLQAELKEIMPHIYIVTIDEHLNSKLSYKNSTYILTD